MSRLHLRSSLASSLGFLAVAAASLAACSKTDSPPGGFGVNLTVDATALSTAQRSAIKSATLRALSDKAGSTVVSRPVDKFADVVQGGTVRFHYTPASSVKAGESLTFALDAFGSGTALVASGSSDPVELKETAVEAKITLAAASAGDGGPPGGDGGDGGGSGKKAKGTACLEDSECDSGFCTDGVCCAERCNDICASCKLQASLGTCTAYPADTDPEMQCVPAVVAPPPADDAGAAPAADGGAVAPPPGDAAASDAAAVESDAAVINPPDGGFMSMPNVCAGTCSGAKSCKFPDKTKSCGTAFCNTRRDVASFTCDGTGGCNIALSPCTDYACDDDVGACRTKCTAHTDCQVGNYCDGPTHMCAPKNTIGLRCTTDEECKSGHCASGVCCNTACDTAPLSCNATGSVGQCKCAECTTGPCQIFYPDSDGDTFGDRTATYAAHTAKAACMGAPPVGFVADNTDCDDKDANAKPGQTGWFNTPSKGTGTFDYNCDGMMQKETPEYPGKSCHFCGAVGSCDPGTSTCTAANQTASYVCPQELSIFQPRSLPIDVVPELKPHMSLAPPTPELAGPDIGAAAAAGAGGAAVPIGPVLPPKFPQCCGCQAADKTGFIQTVNCGDATKYVYTCGSCAAVNQGPSASTRVLKQQQCH